MVRRGAHADLMATTPTPERPVAEPVRYQIRRRHDDSLISAHCCTASALTAFERLTLADLMGPIPAGPLEWAEADIIEVATGASVAYTRGLVPRQPSAPAPTSDPPGSPRLAV